MKTEEEIREEITKRINTSCIDNLDKVSTIVACDWINCLKWVLEE